MLLIKLLSLIDVIAAIILVVIFHKNLQIVRVNSRDPPERVSTGIQAVSSDGLGEVALVWAVFRWPSRGFFSGLLGELRGNKRLAAVPKIDAQIPH